MEHQGRARGFTILFAMLAMTTLVGFTALAVDFGHIQVARFELHAACDAAARAGVQSLGSSTLSNAVQAAAATSGAITIASQNYVDGQPLLLDSTMIQVGNYDVTKSPTFLSGRTPYNAVQVNGYRDAAHNDPIPLALASAVGVTQFNISCVSVAEKPPQPSPYGFVGIASASFASLNVISSLDGSIASNGTVSVGAPLGIGVSVTKDARSFTGNVNKGSLASIGGTTGSLTQQLVYPSVTIPANYDDSAISGGLDASNNYTGVGIADIATGTYVVHDLNLLAGVVVNLHGPVTIYVTGTFNMAATVNLLNLLNSDPRNFNVMVAPGGYVNVIGSLVSPTNMNIYAPDSDITIAVSVNHYTGCLIGKSLTIAVPVISTFTESPPPTILSQTALVQ